MAFCHRHRYISRISPLLGLKLRDVACHQLDARLGKLSARLIVDRDPSEQVGLLVAGHIERSRCNHVIGCRPIKAAGDVGQLRRVASIGFGVDLPAQSRLQKQPIGCRWKERRSGKLELHFAVDFNQGLSRLAVQHLAVKAVFGLPKIAGANDSARNNLRSLRCRDLKVDGLAFVFLQQPLLAHDS